MQKASISCHAQNAVNMKHNNRDYNDNNRPKHINPEREKYNKYYKTGHVMDVYNSQEVKDSVEEYNSRQKRSDRKIGSFYKKCKKNKNKEEKMEIIIAVGAKEDGIDRDLKARLLDEYYQEFEKRNPNYKVYNAVLHNDEDGTPHLHISYVPLAYKSRGMKVDVGNSQATKEMMQAKGYNFKGNNDYYEKWRELETAVLEEIMLQNGIERTEVIKVKDERHDYLPPEVYKKVQDERKRLEAESDRLQAIDLEQKAYDKQIDLIGDNIDSCISHINTLFSAFNEKQGKLLEEKEKLNESEINQANYEYGLYNYVESVLESLDKEKEEFENYKVTEKASFETYKTNEKASLAKEKASFETYKAQETATIATEKENVRAEVRREERVKLWKNETFREEIAEELRAVITEEVENKYKTQRDEINSKVEEYNKAVTEREKLAVIQEPVKTPEQLQEDARQAELRKRIKEKEARLKGLAEDVEEKAKKEVKEASYEEYCAMMGISG